MYSVAVFFENSHTKQYQFDRPYFYVVNQDILRQLELTTADGFLEDNLRKIANQGYINRTAFTVTNEFGHNYSDARTLIFPVGEVSDGVKKECKWITKVASTNKIVRISKDECEQIRAAIASSPWVRALGIQTRDSAGNSIFTNNNFTDNTTPSIMKGEHTMFENIFKNLKVGPVLSGVVRMSMLGLAVMSKERTYVAYDASKNDFVDVTDLLIDGFDEFIYSVPVAPKDIAPGDLIFHGATPVRVVKVMEDGTISAQDMVAREMVTVIPVRNIFGFNFCAKIISLMGNMFSNVNESQPFGAILPFLLMNKTGNKNDMLPLMFAMNGMAGANGAMNPMLMMAMFGKGGNNDMLPFLLMSQNGQNPFANMFGGTTPASK